MQKQIHRQKKIEKKIKEKNIPTNVTKYLKENYLAVKSFEYYQKKERDTTYYEVEFDLNKQQYNLKFSQVGNLLEIEREIEFDELPNTLKEKMQSTLKEKFKKSKIKKVQEVNPDNKKQYEINVKAKSKPNDKQFKNGFYNLFFDSAGNLLSIEEEKLESIGSVF